MKALTFAGCRSIAHGSVPDPRIESPDDVIVAVRRSAVCGSDLHPYHGRERGLDRGTVMGHELAGEIVETGRDVRRLRKGDRVASPFTTSCGRCPACVEGLTARCGVGQLLGWVRDGQGLHGTQAEYVRIPLADSTLLPVPADVGDDETLLLGDVLSTGYYCASNAGVRPGTACAVVGAGPVGLMAVVAARELGAETVFAIDTIPERLALARELGAVPVDARSDDPGTIVREATHGRGVPAVLEAVGSPEAGRLAFELVRDGGTLSVVGVHTEPRFSFTPAEAYDRNLTYRVGRCPARDLMERLLPLVRSRKYPLSSIVTHRLPLERGPEAYAMFDEKRDGCVKVVLAP